MEKEARPSSQAQAQKDARQIVSFPRITTQVSVGAYSDDAEQLNLQFLILISPPGNKLLAPSISAPQIEAHV